MRAQVPADQLASDAEWMVMILRGAVVYAKENHDGQGPPSITLGDASKAADIIEALAKRIKELEPNPQRRRTGGVMSEPTSLTSEKKVPAWAECSLVDRLIMCRVMLYQHGFLTQSEKDRVDARIDKLIRKEAARV